MDRWHTNDNKIQCADWEKLVAMWNMLELESIDQDYYYRDAAHDYWAEGDDGMGDYIGVNCGECKWCKAQKKPVPVLKLVVDNT
jgi:hypothetical protein